MMPLFDVFTDKLFSVFCALKNGGGEEDDDEADDDDDDDDEDEDEEDDDGFDNETQGDTVAAAAVRRLLSFLFRFLERFSGCCANEFGEIEEV